MKTKIALIKVTLGLLTLVASTPSQALPNAQPPFQIVADEPQTAMTEMRYEKLMKLYLNKIKLAFSDTDDARSLAVLTQFVPEFTQKSDAIKSELQALVKNMNPREKEMLFSRLSQRGQTSEIIALLFDERITSRMATNAEIKDVMDLLHAKSLEIQKSGQEFIAIDK